MTDESGAPIDAPEIEPEIPVEEVVPEPDLGPVESIIEVPGKHEPDPEPWMFTNEHPIYNLRPQFWNAAPWMEREDAPPVVVVRKNGKEQLHIYSNEHLFRNTDEIEIGGTNVIRFPKHRFESFDNRCWKAFISVAELELILGIWPSSEWMERNPL